MTLTFELMDLLTGLLIVAAVVLMVFLAVAVRNLSLTLKNVNRILEESRDPLQQTIAGLPGLMEGVCGRCRESE